MQLGVFGLGTMGANLARNAARNGAEVSVFNRTVEKTHDFVKNYGSEGKFIACDTPEAFLESLQSPRAIVLMVKAGDAVDQVVAELLPMLKKGDMLIDAGNSHFRDTKHREEMLAEHGIRFIGMGVSGGEEGALNGPSMMPGGDRSAVDSLMPLLLKMAADDGDGGKCVAHLGAGGSGHFVKMVHNGIEYGIMQLIAEAYDLLKRVKGMKNPVIADVMGEWNTQPLLKSFLLEITEKVLRKQDDETGKSLVDVIKDAAGQKGTGKWTTDAAMHYGVAIPTINAAVDARIISSGKDFRMIESARWKLETEDVKIPADFVERVGTALELSISNTYAQGFVLLSVASTEEKWNLNIPEIARIWRGGCIIRSGMLPEYQKIFTGDKEASQAMMDRFNASAQKAWRSVVALGTQKAIPLPAMSASLSYFDAYRTAVLPQNLIQAQRDFFGAHTFERIDKEGTFHAHWES